MGIKQKKPIHANYITYIYNIILLMTEQKQLLPFLCGNLYKKLMHQRKTGKLCECTAAQNL